jgi:dihydrofolate reductase
MLKTAETVIQPKVPSVALITAMTSDRVIGSRGTLPWHLPDDLLLFKRLTLGCTVMMGRKTHSSIGHPLSGRHNIVLSRSCSELAGAEACGSFMEGLLAAARFGRPLFVIGGAQLYHQALPITSELHISWVKAAHTGNIYFPEFDLDDWVSCDERDYPEFCYVHYRRRN